MEILKSIGDYITGKDIRDYYDSELEIFDSGIFFDRFKNKVQKVSHLALRTSLIAGEIIGITSIAKGYVTFGTTLLGGTEAIRLIEYQGFKKVRKTLEGYLSTVEELKNYNVSVEPEIQLHLKSAKTGQEFVDSIDDTF